MTSRPFDVWSSKIGVDSAELLVRIQRLKREGLCEGIQAVLDPRIFHYQSAWVAMRVEPAPSGTASAETRIEEGITAHAEVLWKHPGVAYGCLREHEFNVWFFIAVPPGHDLELHARCLEKLAGARETLFLPVKRIFKGSDLLNSLDAGTFQDISENYEKRQPSRPPDLSGKEIEMVRQLQEPFPFTDKPYQEIASKAGIAEAQALECIKSLIGKGCLKRIGALSKTAAAARGTKTLVVWQVPEEKLERVGSEIARFREVLYADQRLSYPEFPYSLYTMIGAETAAELEVAMRHIQDRIGKWPNRVLTTVREFKKERIRFFPEGLDAWWHESRHVAETAFH